MLPFHRSSLRPIHRIKHIIDSSQTLTAAGTGKVVLIVGVDAPVLANENEVETGSKVNGIFLNVQCAGNEADVGQIPNAYMAVYKNPSNLIPASLNPESLGDDPNKKLVIHQEMIMNENSANGVPRTLFKGVIVIPKGMRRFGINDELVLVFRSPAQNLVICTQCIYKEFR